MRKTSIKVISPEFFPLWMGLIAIIFTLPFCVVPGCVAPEAVKTEIQGIRNDMGQLEKVVEQKADNTVVAEQVDEINNRIEQTIQLAEELSVWRKSVQAEIINYGGAGWVVVGTRCQTGYYGVVWIYGSYNGLEMVIHRHGSVVVGKRSQTEFPTLD